MSAMVLFDDATKSHVGKHAFLTLIAGMSFTSSFLFSSCILLAMGCSTLVTMMLPNETRQGEI